MTKSASEMNHVGGLEVHRRMGSALEEVESGGLVQDEVKEVEAESVLEELAAMEMMGGELRWMKMSKVEDQKAVLLEERRLEDRYHVMKNV